MELTERKRAILAAIVKYHIATGAPVGSKWLTTTLENAPSSATLRNEMSELSCMGFLEQPHTSAGRIPTGKGYEFYVSNLMQKDELDERERRFIDDSLELAASVPEKLPELAAKLLTRITGLPSFVAKISDEEAIIKKVQLIQMSSHLIMMAAVTQDGRTKSKLCRTSEAIDTDALELLSRIIKNDIEGKKLYELTSAKLQNIYTGAGLAALNLMPIIATLFEMIKEIGQSQLHISGELNIYSMLRESEKAGQLLLFLERKEGIMSLISKAKERVGVIFGADTGFKELESVTVTAAPFGPTESPLWRIGVIGPTRMSYGQIVPCVAYIAARLSDIANKSINDMEEI